MPCRTEQTSNCIANYILLYYKPTELPPMRYTISFKSRKSIGVEHPHPFIGSHLLSNRLPYRTTIPPVSAKSLRYRSAAPGPKPPGSPSSSPARSRRKYKGVLEAESRAGKQSILFVLPADQLGRCYPFYEKMRVLRVVLDIDSLII